MGVGPVSLSRDAANWLPSRFSSLVETRWRYGWLRIVFSGARLFRAPFWGPSGGLRHARAREHCRGEPGSVLSSGYVPDSVKAEGRRARGVLNPCARDSKARTGRFLREKLMSDHTAFFLPTRATRGGERTRFVRVFQGCTGIWTA